MECLSLEKQWKRHPKKHKTSTSIGHIRNEIAHEKERVIEFSISMALDRVQDAVEQAFRSVRDEMIPLYMTTDIEHRDAW